LNKLFLIFFSLLLSCGLTKKANTLEKEPIISLQRTACFGSCPIYKIEIFSNGNGIYTGTKFVEHIGVTQFSLSKTEINLILKRAEDINFANMKNEYSEPISDLPTTFIQIRSKKIRDYTGAPKALKDLENLIDQLYQKTIKE